MIEQIRDVILNNDIFHRVVIFFVSSVIFSHLPVFIFLIYMKQSQFFSYDFFTHGTFGLNIFFIISAIFMLFIAPFAAGGLISLAKLIQDLKERKKEIIEHWPTALVTLIALAINGGLIYKLTTYPIEGAAAQKAWDDGSQFIVWIAAFVCAHIGVILFWSKLTQLFSLFIVTFGIFMIGISYPKQISDFVSIGLQGFGVGGGIPAVITDKNAYEIAKGPLILKTPNTIILQTDNGTKTIERGNDIIIEIITTQNSNEK